MPHKFQKASNRASQILSSLETYLILSLEQVCSQVKTGLDKFEQVFGTVGGAL